jgi:hypothetical protein
MTRTTPIPQRHARTTEGIPCEHTCIIARRVLVAPGGVAPSVAGKEERGGKAQTRLGSRPAQRLQRIRARALCVNLKACG